MPSPTILNKVATMDFPAAIQAVIDGNKITRLEWDDPQYFGTLLDGRLRLHKPDGLFYDWIISYGDLTGTDWVITP